MPVPDPSTPHTLIRDDRVHRSVYTDPAIFALEMQRIFGRAWVYVGHDSQVPQPGDWITTRIGDQPVLMVRRNDGDIAVLHNRCPHKGAQLATAPCGHAERFLRCGYHGWTFGFDGSAGAIPLRDGYDAAALAADPDALRVKPLARVAAYRGFVFASRATDGPPLEDFLGGVRTSLDNFCDRAPTGRVTVAGGIQRVIQRNNWKVFFENLHDTMHPMTTHESSGLAARRLHRAMPEGTPKPFELRIVDGNIEPYPFWAALALKGFDHGHGWMEAIFNPPTDPTSLAHQAALEAVHGPDRTRAILSLNLHNTIVWPSGSPHTAFQQFRVIRPLAVDRTLIEIQTFRLEGAPDAVFERALRYTNVVNSPSSSVMADDLEMYARVQRGLQSDGGDWVSLARGAGRDTVFDGGVASTGNSEMPMRNQFAAWARWMQA
ncbi:MAG: aromatic ring-hydroxylating dioxygenase subunit alpha [Burkholderiales bacterium]|jgi:phenylpropionate dioxygenase-like ring-hydroxylating dioxygenase large terminal subunit|nr:aromatic ring-hydroxylating dioxygenase subunit alpha [Burkholderiales bacterium]